MKRFLPLLAALVFLTATPATAKVIEAVELCGKSECRSLPKSELRGGHSHPWVFGGTAASGVAADAPPRSAGRWRATITIGDGQAGGPIETFPQLVAPEPGYLRVDGVWRPMSTMASREWTRLTKGIEPLPPPKPAEKVHTETGQLDGASTDEPPPQPADEVSADQSGAGGNDAWPWIAVGAAGLVALLAVRRRRSIR
jgi:MYXO-CTERM domain-containing protein